MAYYKNLPVQCTDDFEPEDDYRGTSVFVYKYRLSPTPQGKSVLSTRRLPISTTVV